MDDTLATLWRFVRGDMAVRDFEAWLYADESLELRFGKPLYLQLISADFRDAQAIRQVRSSLDTYARTQLPLACECITLAETSVIDMAHPGGRLDHFERLRDRGEPYWWLQLERCTVCGTGWLVAQEERQNDVFLLHRLSENESQAILTAGRWPSDFDSYETLLRLGRAAGHTVWWPDAVGDSSLEWTMADLARQRPGISVSELSELLDLDPDTTAIIAEQTIIAHGVDITLDNQPWR